MSKTRKGTGEECLVKDCGREAVCRGLCSRCYGSALYHVRKAREFGVKHLEEWGEKLNLWSNRRKVVVGEDLYHEIGKPIKGTKTNGRNKAA